MTAPAFATRSQSTVLLLPLASPAKASRKKGGERIVEAADDGALTVKEACQVMIGFLSGHIKDNFSPQLWEFQWLEVVQQYDDADLRVLLQVRQSWLRDFLMAEVKGASGVEVANSMLRWCILPTGDPNEDADREARFADAVHAHAKPEPAKRSAGGGGRRRRKKRSHKPGQQQQKNTSQLALAPSVERKQ